MSVGGVSPPGGASIAWALVVLSRPASCAQAASGSTKAGSARVAIAIGGYQLKAENRRLLGAEAQNRVKCSTSGPADVANTPGPKSEGNAAEEVSDMYGVTTWFATASFASTTLAGWPVASLGVAIVYRPTASANR